MIIPSIEQERRMYRGNDPDVLRRRMAERDEPETEASVAGDFDLLSALHRMDDAGRMAALELLPDADIRRVVELIPVWRALQEMSREELEQLFGEMDE